MTSPETEAAARGLRGLAARHPLTVFLGLVLGFGWAIMSLMVLAAHGVIDLPLPAPVFVLVVNLGVMLPAALWVTAVTDGRAGVRALLARAGRWRFPAAWWGVVLLPLPVLTAVVAVISGATIADGPLGIILLKQLGSAASAVALINLWEETVWAGFLQTRLERRHGFFTAAALTALPFAGVHIPLLLMRPTLSVSTFLTDLAGLVILAVVARTMWGVVLRGARDSTLAVGIMHGMFNASNNKGQLVDSVLVGADVNRAAMIVLAIVAATLVLANRSRLTPAYRLARNDTAPPRQPVAPGSA